MLAAVPVSHLQAKAGRVHGRNDRLHLRGLQHAPQLVLQDVGQATGTQNSYAFTTTPSTLTPKRYYLRRSAPGIVQLRPAPPGVL